MRDTHRDAPEAALRTYVDDWRVFAAGLRRRAARDAVESLRAAKAHLEDMGMVVNLRKTVLLASSRGARERLRAEAGDLRGLVATTVKIGRAHV